MLPETEHQHSTYNASDYPVVLIIVHHNSPQTLFNTVENLQALKPDHILVVDNSADDTIKAQLDAKLPANISTLYTENRGYAAAINAAVEWYTNNGWADAHHLVCTHETLIVRGAIEDLTAAITSPKVAAVGPLLVQRDDHDVIWSAGGSLSRMLNLPRHDGIGEEAFRYQSGYLRAEWMDGACVLFRNGVLAETPLDESFFLYFEELDHQSKLRKAGHELWISCAVHASQTTDGPPFHYMIRNFALYHSKHHHPVRAVPGLAALLAREVYRAKSLAPVGAFSKALRAATTDQINP